MDENVDNECDKRDEVDGIIAKAASVETSEVSEKELACINKFTLSPLKAEDVFTFKLVMGDNEIDDRNYEPFNLNALKDMQKQYIGKTVIKDHSRKADNQIARVYDTELITEESKTTGAGEPFTKLVAKCYMLKTESNKDLIAEINAGIKKEVSTSCRPKHAYCSICGTDNTKSYCNHFWGREYDTKDGKKTCYFTLDGVKECYEVSFVAVPAQKRAGTTKGYGAKEFVQEKEEIAEENQNNNKESLLNTMVKINDSFLFIKNLKGESENE